MIALLLKASLIIIALLAFYKLFLEKESFFSANRIYLLSCLGLACLLPIIAIPKVMEHQGYIATLIESTTLPKPSRSGNAHKLEKSTSSNHIEILKEERPANSLAKTEITLNPPSVQVVQSEAPITTIPTEPHSERGISYWMMILYLFGLAVLTINILAQIIQVFWRIHNNSDSIDDGDAIIVNMTGEVEPCSFFKYIFINPASYDHDTYEQIIAHEKIHVNKWHTLDLLISEIAAVVLWFNPFVWLLRKEVEKNIEYQTDDMLLEETATKKETYQMNLVNIACHTQPLAITTNYNQSLIKQRILKMNTKKSNKYRYWKYTFTAPLIFALLLLLNKPNTLIAQAIEEPQAAPIQELENLEPPTKKEEVNEQAPFEKGTNADPFVNTSSESTTAVKTDNDCGLLTRAIRSRDLSKVKELLQSIDPNCIDPDPGYEIIAQDEHMTMHRSHARTPLSAAARAGYLEIGKILLASGAEVDFDEREITPLSEAAHEGHIDFVNYLIDEGADIRLGGGRYGSALSSAAHGGHNHIVELLLNKGADIHVSGGAYGSVLSSAADNGHTSTIELLLNKGADIDAMGGAYGTPLNTAANNGHVKAVELLLDKGADIDLSGGAYGTALNSAANNGHTETVALLIDKGADLDQIGGAYGAALNTAANNGHDKTVELLLDKGADLTVNAGAYGTALGTAANNGHHKTVELLLKRGADINAIGGAYGTPLNTAANNGHRKTVELLLDKGADINASGGAYGTALSTAANNGHHSTVELLLNEGAHLDAIGGAYGTALNTELLLEKGADVNAIGGAYGTALSTAANNGHNKTVELLLEKGADVNATGGAYGTALSTAANNGHHRTVELLLDKGADIDGTGGAYGTALNTAANNGHRKTIELLLDKGADVNTIGGAYGTALNTAANNGHLSVVKLLIENGADVNYRAGGQGTALDIAYKNRHRRVVKYLESQGAK